MMNGICRGMRAGADVRGTSGASSESIGRSYQTSRSAGSDLRTRATDLRQGHASDMGDTDAETGDRPVGTGWLPWPTRFCEYARRAGSEEYTITELATE